MSVKWIEKLSEIYIIAVKRDKREMSDLIETKATMKKKSRFSP